MEASTPEQPVLRESTAARSSLGPLSIHDLARRHPRSRILVEPLLWTPLHLELLRCSFSAVFDEPLPAMAFNTVCDDKSLDRLAHRLSSDSFDRAFAVEGLLGDLDGPLRCHRPLFFNLRGYRYIELPCAYYCLRAECGGRDNSSVPLVAAVIDYDSIIRSRKKRIINTCIGSRYNKIAVAMAHIKQRKYASILPLQEPYLAAVLIALAQHQWSALGPTTRKQASGVKPKLVYVSDDAESLHVYSSNVSSAFLSMFDDPSLAPSAQESLSIHITAIPYQPFATLQSRLLAQLLSASSPEVFAIMSGSSRLYYDAIRNESSLMKASAGKADLQGLLQEGWKSAVSHWGREQLLAHRVMCSEPVSRLPLFNGLFVDPTKESDCIRKLVAGPGSIDALKDSSEPQVVQHHQPDSLGYVWAAMLPFLRTTPPARSRAQADTEGSSMPKRVSRAPDRYGGGVPSDQVAFGSSPDYMHSRQQQRPPTSDSDRSYESAGYMERLEAPLLEDATGGPFVEFRDERLTYSYSLGQSNVHAVDDGGIRVFDPLRRVTRQVALLEGKRTFQTLVDGKAVVTDELLAQMVGEALALAMQQHFEDRTSFKISVSRADVVTILVTTHYVKFLHFRIDPGYIDSYMNGSFLQDKVLRVDSSVWFDIKQPDHRWMISSYLLALISWAPYHAAQSNSRLGSVADPSPPDSTSQVPRLLRADNSDLTPPSHSHPISLLDRLHIGSTSRRHGHPAGHATAGPSSSSAREASRGGGGGPGHGGSGIGSGAATTTNDANSKKPSPASGSASASASSTQKHPANLTCPLCSKRFTRSYNLRSHLRTHNNERPFECSVCGKAFARQHDRKRHERLHLGEKQFICRGDLELGRQWGCGRAFSRVDGLARHLRSDMGSECIRPLFDQEYEQQRRGLLPPPPPPPPMAGMSAPGAATGMTMAQQHAQHQQHQQPIGFGEAFATTATTPMDIDTGMTWPSLETGTGWTSMAPLPAALLAHTADPFPMLSTLFDFDSATTSEAGTRTPGAGAYTKWWSSYSDASSGMKTQEHREDPEGGQMDDSSGML
ncbi:hypothetical protein O9K51_03412 [Purpureocillium lavendulum]|uniref:C2H2-type domain-containing protein n=1 Tax=Purpureocillium lavendulum TaxID=1247861 RepID=A0AB34G0U6_9HYPO|nr:hypothetical protein O9K51_03412 [Purpureocillium lavendulum]